MGMEKYDINTKKAVGRGAFGVVYLYQRKSDRKDIIIKQITIDDLTTDQRRGVMNEIKVTAIFNHPNIVKYHEYFVEDNTFNIVMEYAPGGNLFDYLQVRFHETRILEEEEILKFFGQIARAMHHIHSYNILHRDMKTHNILLDQRKKVVKICDFGISRFLTKTDAMTTVGTAHYMSPEVVEGKSYNKKSDIWSLGCILYELIALKRAFDGDTMPVILHKILKCEYPNMPDYYSEELKGLVKTILVNDQVKRPDVNMILASPVLISSLLDLETDVGRIPCLYGYGGSSKMKKVVSNGSRQSSALKRMDSTVHKTVSFTEWGDEVSRQAAEQTSAVYCWGGGTKMPVVLPGPAMDQFINQVCCGRTKKLGLTSNGRVFMWESGFATATSNKFEDKDSSVNQSSFKIEIIGELSRIEKLHCGDRFVLVKSDRGVLTSWGSGEHGCLGHGTMQDSSKPKVIERLVPCTVVQASCGSSHVLALTNDGQVYAWGKGSAGNLGLNDRNERLIPTVVPLDNIRVKSVVCGSNHSFIITNKGAVYACGSNKENKLALATDEQLSTGIIQEDYLVFTKLTCKPLKEYKILNISTGPYHSAFVTETGVLFTSGTNKNKQLGYKREEGDYRPDMVHSVSEKGVKHVGCGDTYTVAVTVDNRVFSWGAGRNGRLGLGSVEETSTPQKVRIDYHKLNFHSLSVCLNTTLLAGKSK